MSHKFSLRNHTSVALLVVAMSTYSCGPKAPQETTETKPTETTATASDTTVREEKAQDFFHSLPSPIHIAHLFRRAGLKYVDGLGNAPESVSKYQSEYSSSLNIGVYTTDLAYATFNNKSQVSISYFKAVRTLGEKLNMASIFDKHGLLPRFEKNLNNQDSLLNIMADMHMESDLLLKETSRRDVVYLSFAGAWVESMYIATSLIAKESNPALTKRVIHQSITLNKLIKLLEDYKDRPQVADLIAKLNEVKATLDKLNEQKDAMNPADFQKFTEQVKEIRGNIIASV
jgi:hypothetical protein